MRLIYFGRVSPERADITAPSQTILHKSDAGEFHINIYIVRSRIFAHVTSDISNFDAGSLKNTIFSLMSHIVDAVGFFRHIGLQIELEGVTDIEAGKTELFGWDGYAFTMGDELDGYTFQIPTDSSISLQADALFDPYFCRSTHELRNSIRYPDYTALHCRLAIEAIRNAFDDVDESKGWERLRSELRVRKETIQSFKDAADLQRHGRNTEQTWPQRRDAMRIAWEIVSRYYQTRYMKLPLSTEM